MFKNTLAIAALTSTASAFDVNSTAIAFDAALPCGICIKNGYHWCTTYTSINQETYNSTATPAETPNAGTCYQTSGEADT